MPWSQYYTPWFLNPNGNGLFNKLNQNQTNHIIVIIVMCEFSKIFKIWYKRF